MDVPPEDTMEQVTHMIQDKGGIKPCNVSLYMIDALCNCGKTVNQLLLEDISAEIEIEYRPSEEDDNNDVSISHINFLYEEAKRNHLIDEISRNLQLELKGLVAQQYTEIKHKIKSTYDKNHEETIKNIEKEIGNLKGELANINQLLSNSRSKNSTCFIQRDPFPQKPAEESNENIDFAIDTPSQCHIIPLNSTNCDEGDEQLKKKLDEQLKEIRKCHHQRYLNTKPIINNIIKSNCLEQKCELIMEKNNDNIESCTEYKIDSKITSNEETESVEKTISREKPPPEKSVDFLKLQRNSQDSENDNNEESQLIVKDTNNTNNNNEDNCVRVNGSIIENGINEVNVKSNQNKSAFILGDSMVKDVDGYLLTGSINRKFIVKVRPFSSAKTIDMEDYTKPTKRDFNPDLYIIHVGTNDLSLDDTPEVISSRIIDTAKSLMTEKSKVVISNIVPRGDKYKEKEEILSKVLNEACSKENIPVINHNNINPKRHLNRSKLHFSNYGNSIFVKNIRNFLSNLI